MSTKEELLTKRERIAIHILLWIVQHIVNPTKYTHQVKELQTRIDEELKTTPKESIGGAE